MPPKGGGPSKKTVEKQKQKIVEDKTFGLKNKNKSKKVQEYVKTVEKQVKGATSKKQESKIYEEKKQKQKELEEKKLLDSLIKPAVEKQKVSVGVNPKSVLCQYFKAGACNKGEKCKFSHDLEIERKSEKADPYVDRRNIGKDPSQIPERSKQLCKYFLEAVEQKKFGWFWECPNNGDQCQYQHALPQGWVIKESKEEEEEKPEDQMTIEEKIEQERNKLETRTPLTLETFLKWKENKKKEKEKKDEEREKEIKQGKQARSGREMFTYDPSLFVDEEDVMDATELEPEEEETGPIRIIEATGTSISMNIINGEEESGKEEVKVEESLFEDDIDLEEEEQEEGSQENGKEEKKNLKEEEED